ncbi:MAG: OmpH family outer membrane protein [Deltaproteobacteria bacterium]|nr:OmpH family outer membrane protein [Deltaproteobacteria bacterium]
MSKSSFSAPLRRASLALTLVAAFQVRTAAAKPGADAKPGAETLIGYVNLQRAILEVEEGKRAKNALKETFEKKQKSLQERESELMRLKESIEKESVVTNNDETKKRMGEFQSKLLELKQVFMKEQQELQETEQKQLAGITTKMREIVQQIGKDGGYTIILEVQDSRLLYAQPHLDLTNEVIRKFNAKHK